MIEFDSESLNSSLAQRSIDTFNDLQKNTRLQGLTFYFDFHPDLLSSDQKRRLAALIVELGGATSIALIQAETIVVCGDESLAFTVTKSPNKDDLEPDNKQLNRRRKRLL
jgi:hypothetical protein